MSVEVRLNEQPIEVLKDAPTTLSLYIIPGSDTLFAGNDCGQFLLQVINLEKFSIVFAVLQPKKDVWFSISSRNDLILSHLSLKGNFKYSIDEKIIDIPEGKYNIFLHQDCMRS